MNYRNAVKVSLTTLSLARNVVGGLGAILAYQTMDRMGRVEFVQVFDSEIRARQREHEDAAIAQAASRAINDMFGKPPMGVSILDTSSNEIPESLREFVAELEKNAGAGTRVGVVKVEHGEVEDVEDDTAEGW